VANSRIAELQKCAVGTKPDHQVAVAASGRVQSKIKKRGLRKKGGDGRRRRTDAEQNRSVDSSLSKNSSRGSNLEDEVGGGGVRKGKKRGPEWRKCVKIASVGKKHKKKKQTRKDQCSGKHEKHPPRAAVAEHHFDGGESRGRERMRRRTRDRRQSQLKNLKEKKKKKGLR